MRHKGFVEGVTCKRCGVEIFSRRTKEKATKHCYDCEYLILQEKMQEYKKQYDESLGGY